MHVISQPNLDFDYRFYGRGTSLATIQQDHRWQGRKMIVMEQTHGDAFQVIDGSYLAANSSQTHHLETVAKVDAVITDQPQLAMMIKSADCLPIVITDGTQLAAIHASRHTINLDLPKKVGLAFKSNTATYLNREKITIQFGPHICFDCYQINRENDVHFNLQHHAREQLKEVLPNAEISDCDACTCHQQDLFYSYRREGAGVPMNYTVVALQKNKRHP